MNNYDDKDLKRFGRNATLSKYVPNLNRNVTIQ